jgi:hypothetical protein
LSTSNNCCGAGTNPTLTNLATPAFFSSTNTFQLDIVTATTQYVFAQLSPTQDAVNLFGLGSAGAYQSTLPLTSETLGVPAPIPGAGALSWLLAGCAGMLFRFRRRIGASVRRPSLWGRPRSLAPRLAADRCSIRSI